MSRRRSFAIEDLIWFYIERALIRIGVVFCVLAVGVLIWGEWNLARLGLDEIESFQVIPERIPVEEQMWQYIRSLPLPEEEIPEEYSAQEYMSYTTDDVYLLAQAMHAEEGVFFRKFAEDPDEVEYVHKLCGSVILHRLENNHRGCESIEEVIFCDGQYAEQTLQRVRDGQDIPELVYTWAEELLKEGPLGPNNLIYQSEFEQGVVYDTIGNQIFGCEPNLIK